MTAYDILPLIGNPIAWVVVTAFILLLMAAFK